MCREGIIPTYQLINTGGYDHARMFTMQVIIALAGTLTVTWARVDQSQRAPVRNKLKSWDLVFLKLMKMGSLNKLALDSLNSQ